MWRVGLSLVMGALTGWGFAPLEWWPLAIIGPAGLTVAVAAARRARGAAGLGLVYGVGLLSVGIGWMNVIFTQAMVGLIAVEALFYAIFAVLLRLALRTPLWPLIAAASWTAIEYGFSHFPFNGFGWMRLGYALVDSPLAWGFPIFGVAGVGFLGALTAQGLAWLLDAPSRRRGVIAGIGAVAILAVSGSGLFVQPGASSGTVNAGWVQGGAPGGGVYGLGEARTITRNHVAETDRLMTKIEAGELPRPDFIVWPENSTDLDPFADAQTGALVQTAVARADLPILTGVILNGPGRDERQTVSIWWDPVGGPQQRYVKRGIVPFGEWVPLRDLLLPLIPELRYVGAQSVAGTEPGVIAPRLSDGRTPRLGLMVCYDLAFDDVVADTVTHGGQVTIVQSSNAMYQGTGQINQQFAITRARAMELRREVLVVTTSGISGLILPDGSVAYRTSDYVSASGVTTLPLRDGVTPAAAYAWLIELLIMLGALLGLGYSVVWGRMATLPSESGAEHD